MPRIFAARLLLPRVIARVHLFDRLLALLHHRCGRREPES